MSSAVKPRLDEALELEWRREWGDAAQIYRSLSATTDHALRCLALLRLARCLLESGGRGEADAADDALADARRLVGELDRPELTGQLRLQQGRLYEHQGSLKRALERYNEARALLESVPLDLIEVDLALAAAERRRGDLERALNRLTSMQTGGLPMGLRAECQHELAAVLMDRGEFRRAADELETTYDLDRDTGSPGTRSLLLLGEAYLRVGDREPARGLIDQAVEACDARRDYAGLSDAYALFGAWHEDVEQYLQAARYYQKSLDLDQKGEDVLGEVRAKRRLARIYRKAGDSARARELVEDARSKLPREDHVEGARLWQEEGDLALAGSQPDYEKAIARFERALSTAVKNGDQRVIAVAKRKLARAYREDDDLEKAESLLREARTALTERGDLRELDDLLDDLGEVLLEQDRYEEAEQALRESLELDEQLGRIGSKARSLMHLGRVVHERGRSNEAGEYLRSALKVYEEAEQEVGTSEALQHLGAWHLEQGQLEPARSYLKRGLAIDTRLDDPLGRVRAKRLLGAVYREGGDLDRAEEYLHEAASDLRHIDDPVEHAFVVMEEGRLALARGLYRLAREGLEAAASSFDREGDRPGDVATCNRFVALAAAYEADYGEALRVLGDAEAVFLELEDWPELDELYDDRATVHLLRGHPELAQADVDKSLAAGRQVHRQVGRGRSLLLKARIAAAQGDGEQTKRRLQEALDAFSSLENEVGEAEVHIALGDWYTDPRNDGRDLTRAVGEYRAARRLERNHQDRRGVAHCNRKLAEVYVSRDELERADGALEDAEESLRDIDDAREWGPIELVRGRLWVALGHRDQAVTHFRRAVEYFRTLKHNEQVDAAYEALLTSYQALGRTEDAAECIREMGLETASFYNALVGELHPRIAEKASPSFAQGHYRDAVQCGFRELEAIIRERTADLPKGDQPKGISTHMARWLTSDHPDVPTFKVDAGKDKFRELTVAGFGLLYNSAKHSTVVFSVTDAYAALSVAHLVARIIDHAGLPWEAAMESPRDSVET